MSRNERQKIVYVPGGPVQATPGGLYISRKADKKLHEFCEMGTFTYVLTPRQMGKSSLMLDTVGMLNGKGVQTAIVDLQALGVQVNAEEWYLGILVAIEEQIELKTNIVKWWKENNHLGLTQRLTRFFQKVLVKEATSQIVIFVDEIDTTLSLDFSDDFYTAIRYLYNARAQDPDLNRLSFVLIGVASPGDLIKDRDRTPFNIGQRLDLTDFTFEEALPLVAGLKLPEDEGTRVLRWVLEWTNGHPYLTQRIFRELARINTTEWDKEKVDLVVAETFFGEKSQEDNNLQFVRDMLTHSDRVSDTESVLITYRTILRNVEPVPDSEQSKVISQLKLSGIVCSKDGVLEVRNDIYRRVFSEEWIKIPVNWKRRLTRVAGVAGLIMLLGLIPLSILAFLSMKEAKVQKGVADRALRRNYLENGRQELIDNYPLRASVYLNGAYQRYPSTETSDEKSNLLFLLGQSMPGVEALDLTLKHGSDINFAAFSPDGKMIATASDDWSAKVWDLTRETPLLFSCDHRDSVNSVEFSPDGRRVVTASDDTKAGLWEIGKKDPLGFFPHNDIVFTARFSPDGTKVVTNSNDAKATLWDTSNFEKSLIEWQHPDDVNTVEFSPDGTKVLTACDDGGARIWSTEKINGPGSLQPELLLRHTSAVKSARYSFDGTKIVTAEEGESAKIWDARTGRMIRSIETNLKSAIFSPDGTRILTVGDGSSVSIWNTSSGKLLATFDHQKEINSAEFSPDGQRVVTTCGHDKITRVWDANTTAVIATFEHEGFVNSARFSPDGMRVVTASDDYTSKVWNARTSKFRHLPIGSVNLARLSPDAKSVAIVGPDKKATVVDIVTGKPQVSLDHNDKIESIEFSPSGKKLVAACSDKTVRIWDAGTGKLFETLEDKDSVNYAAFSQDENTLLSIGDKKNTVKIWDVNQKQILFSLPPYKDVIRHAEFFKDNDRSYIVTSSDESAKIWDLKTGRFKSLEHQFAVNSATFSHDGNKILTTSGDLAAELWNVVPEKPVLEFSLEGLAIVNSAQFSPDGNMIVVANDDKTVSIWDVKTGKMLVEVQDLAKYAEFSKDGMSVMIVGKDGMVEFWDIAPETRSSQNIDDLIKTKIPDDFVHRLLGDLN